MKLDLLTPRFLGAVWLPLLGISPVAADEAKAPVERIGPPSYYAPPVERYRSSSPDMNNPSYYPIPKTPVTRATYMEWIDNSGMLDFVDQPKRGMGGPTLLLPVLAKYVQTKDARWGQACIAMLKDYHRAFKVEIEAKGWVEQFAEPPAFIPVYRKHLLDGGLITPKLGLVSRTLARLLSPSSRVGKRADRMARALSSIDARSLSERVSLQMVSRHPRG